MLVVDRHSDGKKSNLAKENILLSRVSPTRDFVNYWKYEKYQQYNLE